jgi:hypothetical protein
MTTVHVRVTELRTSEPHSFANRLLLLFETRGSQKPKLGKVSGDSFLNCDGTWTFTIGNQTNEFLSVTLQRRHFFTANDAIAKCVLPLSWFPTNRMVREWFPMVRDSDASGADIRATIQIDVHVDTRAADPFMVAFSNLRVIPTWPRPPDHDTECPAPPQVIYVVADDHAGADGQISYRPVGCAQYPDPAALHSPLAAHAGSVALPIAGPALLLCDARAQAGFPPNASPHC